MYMVQYIFTWVFWGHKEESVSDGGIFMDIVEWMLFNLSLQKM